MNNVYVITMPGHPYCKIGFAKNLPVRLSSLQMGSPYKIEYFYTREVEEDLAGWVEADVHLALENHEASGEWFRIEPEKAMGLVDSCLENLLEISWETIESDSIQALKDFSKKHGNNAAASLLNVTVASIWAWKSFGFGSRSKWRARQVQQVIFEYEKQETYHVFTSVLRGPQNKAAA